jgi:toxin HigB-1
MIQSFQNKPLEYFYIAGSLKGINPKHAVRIFGILSFLDNVELLEDITNHSKYRHSLKGKYKGFHSMIVSGNWRIIFEYYNGDVFLVDYLDYH